MVLESTDVYCSTDGGESASKICEIPGISERSRVEWERSSRYRRDLVCEKDKIQYNQTWVTSRLIKAIRMVMEPEFLSDAGPCTWNRSPGGGK